MPRRIKEQPNPMRHLGRPSATGALNFFAVGALKQSIRLAEGISPTYSAAPKQNRIATNKGDFDHVLIRPSSTKMCVECAKTCPATTQAEAHWTIAMRKIVRNKAAIKIERMICRQGIFCRRRSAFVLSEARDDSERDERKTGQDSHAGGVRDTYTGKGASRSMLLSAL